MAAHYEKVSKPPGTAGGMFIGRTAVKISPKKTWRKTLNPLDYPHRASGSVYPASLRAPNFWY